MRWTNEEIEILTQHYGQISINDIVKLIPNHPRQSICRKASYLGLTNFTKNQSLSQKIYTIDENFFGTPNIKNSYWAGFIAADGNLTKDGGIRIVISNKDKILLDTFKQHVNYNGEVKEYITKDGSYSKIDLWSLNRWHCDLNLNWNIPLKNKTHTLIPPELQNQDLILAYAIGLIDGDGCIYYNNNRLCFGFCGTQEIVKWMRNLWLSLVPNCKIDYRLNGCSKTNYRIMTYTNVANDIIDCFLKINIPWRLQRKWKNKNLTD